MKSIAEVYSMYQMDIKKRAARIYGSGGMTKQEFDKLCEELEKLEEHLPKTELKKRS